MKIKQSGFTLAEMLVVLGIIAIIINGSFIRDARKRQSELAKHSGALLAEYNGAVAELIRDNGATTPLGTFNGVTWLKSPACPGGIGAVDYLPCNFPNNLSFGLQFSTVVANVGGNIVATTTAGPGVLQVGGSNRLDLAGDLAVAASAKSDGGSGTATYDLNGANLITASYTTVGNPDAFLRLDGTNQMAADANIGGNRVVNSSGLDFGSSELNNDQGGSIELGGTNTTPGTGQSYIDFHQAGLTEDFNVRIENSSDGVLRITAPNGVEIQGDLRVAGTSSADEMVITTLNGGQDLSEGVYFATVAAHGATIAKPTCPAGKTPQIFTNTMMGSNNADGRPIGAYQATAIDLGANWQNLLRILVESGFVNPNSTFGRNVVFTKCS